MFMGISDDDAHARQRRNFLGSPLGVAAGHDDLRVRILSSHAPDRRPRILVGGCRHGAGIQYHHGCLRGSGSPGQASLLELAFESCPIRLRGAASEVFYVVSGHMSMVSQRMLAQRATRTLLPAPESMQGPESGITPKRRSSATGSIPGRKPDGPGWDGTAQSSVFRIPSTSPESQPSYIGSFVRALAAPRAQRCASSCMS